jgi:hypothetical protein
MKEWWKSKTIWLGIAQALVGAIFGVVELIQQGSVDATAAGAGGLGMLTVLARAVGSNIKVR